MADTSSKPAAPNPDTRAGKVAIWHDQIPSVNTPEGRAAAAQAAVDKNAAQGQIQNNLAGQGGGKGLVGGKYGVTITDQSAVGGLKSQGNNKQNVDWNIREKEYVSSLKNNRGILPPSTLSEAQDPNNQYNKAIYDYERGNNLIRDTRSQNESLLTDFLAAGRTTDKGLTSSSKLQNNNKEFGYTPDAKLSPIITSNFSKNPIDVTYEVTPAGQGQINFFQSSHGTKYGGVETEKSKELGNKYSRENLDKQSQSIGTLIFSNQKSLERNSPFENKVKESEAERAKSVYPSFSNKDYVNGESKQPDYNSVIALGKAKAFFGNQEKFGWNDVSKDQLVRGSKEEKLSTLGAFAGRENTRLDSMGGKPFEVAGGLTGGVKGSVVFQAAKAGQATILEKPQPKTEQQPIDFNTFYQGAESRGSTINVYNAQGARIGSFKATEENKSGLDSFAGSGVYFREEQKNGFSSEQNRAFADYISSQSKSGATIELFSGGQKVGEVSGPNAYRDLIQYSKNGPIVAQVDYSTTPEGKTFLDIVSKGGVVAFAEPITGSSLGILATGDKNAKSTLNNIVAKSQNGFNYSVLYPKEEQKLLSDIKANPGYYIQQSINNPNFFDSAYASGKLQTNDASIISGIFHNYIREQNKTFVEQNKQNAAFISNINERNDPSYYFNIKDASGKVVKTTTGERSYYDFIRTNLDIIGGVSISPHFSNTVEAASKREDKLTNSLNQGVEAYGPDVKPSQPQLGGLQAIPRLVESTLGGYAGGLESAFSHLYEKNKSPDITFPGLGGVPETAKNMLSNPQPEFAGDVIHTFDFGVSLSSLSKGQIRASNVKLTPEATTLSSRTSAPSSMGYLMGKEPINPNVNKEYYDIQTAFLIGGAIEGVRGIAKSSGTGWFKTKLEFKTPVENKPTELSTTQKETQYKQSPYYQGITIFNRPIVGKTPNGYVFGNPIPEKAIPQESIPIAAAERGREIYTTSNLEQKLTVNNPDFFKALENRNILALGSKESRAVELEYYLTREFQSAAIPQKSNEVPQISSASPEVNTSVNKSISKMQGRLNIFNINRGRAGSKYGSGVTYNFLDKSLASLVKPADTDVHASQPLGVLEEYRATNMTKYTQENIQKDLGILPEKGIGFHGTDIESAQNIKENGIDVFASSIRGLEAGNHYPPQEPFARGFFLGYTLDIGKKLGKTKAESRELAHTIIKVKFNPKETLYFEKLDKPTQESISSILNKNDRMGRYEKSPLNYLEFQENMRQLALSKGKSVYTKPYHTTNPKAPPSQYEAVIINPKSAKSIDILGDIQITSQEGRRIYGEKSGEATGGKIAEFITSRDVGGGSSLNTSGQVAGISIDSTKYKQILPTGEKVTTVSGKAQEAGNLSKIALQDLESAKAQNANEKQLAFFEGGKKILINSEAFAGKAVARNYLQHLDLATDLMKNPSTKTQGESIYNANEELLSIRGEYHGITKEDIFAGKYNEPETLAEKTSMRETFNSIASTGKTNYNTPIKSVIFGSSSSLLAKNSSGISISIRNSLPSGKSGYNGKSNSSIFSGKSGLSGKSGKSGLSGKSSLSGLSGKSGPSGKSAPSILSSFSTTSGPSGPSLPSGGSTPSGPSGKSGVSGFSGISGFSGFSGFNNSNPPPNIPKSFIFGNIGRKRKNKTKEGPTALINLGVRNIFSSSLNIDIAKNRRYEF